MLDDTAFGIGRADVGTLGARVLAVTLDAGLVIGAIVVGLAFGTLGHDGHNAAHERIANQSSRTRADWVVADHLAPGVQAAGTRTRITALLSDAGQAIGAVRVGGAFGSARNVRVADETGKTVTADGAILCATLGIGAARIRFARIVTAVNRRLDDHRNGRARRERIAGVAVATDAHRVVVGDATFGVDAAGVGARVGAAVADAALVLRTVTVEDALGPTRHVWIADVIGWTRAGGGAADVAALSVEAAWERHTTRFRLLFDRLHCNIISY